MQSFKSWIGRHPSSLFLSLSAPNPYSQLDHKSCLPCCDATHPIDKLTLSLNCLAGASHSFTLYLHNTYILADLPLKIQPLMILNWPLKRFLKVFCKELFDFILLDHWGRFKTRTTVPTHPPPPTQTRMSAADWIWDIRQIFSPRPDPPSPVMY